MFATQPLIRYNKENPFFKRSQTENGVKLMLNESLASYFIEQLGECTDYSINIINKSGFVLASSDPDRVGKFHEVAYKMIQEKIDVMEVREESDFLGVRPGINMIFYHRKKPVGIIGVTGNVETMRSIAPVIRKSVEVMLECELRKTALLYRKSAREQLLNYLLYLDIDQENLSEIYNLFDHLGYRKELPRIPLLLSLHTDMHPEHLLERAKELLPLSSQDILSLDHKGQLILFLSYSESLDGFFEEYRFYIGNFFKEFLTWCRSHSFPFMIYAGPMQVNPVNYKYGYEKTLWLKENIKKADPGGVYFYEHVGEYLKSHLPLTELHNIFEAFQMNYPPQFFEQLLINMDVLYENNYNFQQSSKQLFIHKNTLAFRLDKIRERLGADPIRNLKDRELIEYMCYYFHQVALHQTI